MSVGFDQVADSPWGWKTSVRDPRATPAQPAAPQELQRARLVGLIGGMAAHDEAALASFYDLTVGKLYALVLRLTRNAPLAEEVVADTYHQAWRQAGTYVAGRASPLTWLVMMGRSRALDALRARDPAVLHDAPEELLGEAEVAERSDPLDLLCVLESNQALHAAVAMLSPAQRQMIGLAFFRGLSHQEIADETRMPLGTVKSQIRRALEALRGHLSAREGAPENR